MNLAVAGRVYMYYAIWTIFSVLLSEQFFFLLSVCRLLEKKKKTIEDEVGMAGKKYAYKGNRENKVYSTSLLLQCYLPSLFPPLFYI